jgi:hypothetical protein
VVKKKGVGGVTCPGHVRKKKKRARKREGEVFPLPRVFPQRREKERG